MNKKVLLIDDSITIHRVIDLSIDEEKFDIEKVFTADEANAKFNEFSPDIILLDNKLDNTRIDEFVREIRSVLPSAKIILLVGAFDNFSDADAERIGVDDYLIKPFNSSSLDEKLTNLSNSNNTEKIDETKSEPTQEQEKDEAVEELMASISNNEEEIKNEEIESFDEFFSDEPDTEIKKDTECEIENKEIEEIEEATILNEENTIEVEESVENQEETIDDLFDDLNDDIEKDNSNELEIQNTFEDTEVKIDENILEDFIEEDTDNQEKNELEIASETDDEIDDIFGDLEEVEEEDNKMDLNLEEETDRNDIAENEIPQPTSSIKLEEETSDIESFDEVTNELKNEITEDNQTTQQQTESITPDSIDVKITKETIKQVVAEILDEEFLKETIKEILNKNLEKVIWETVPDMTEKLILEEIERLKKGE